MRPASASHSRLAQPLNRWRTLAALAAGYLLSAATLSLVNGISACDSYGPEAWWLWASASAAGFWYTLSRPGGYSVAEASPALWYTVSLVCVPIHVRSCSAATVPKHLAGAIAMWALSVALWTALIVVCLRAIRVAKSDEPIPGPESVGQHMTSFVEEAKFAKERGQARGDDARDYWSRELVHRLAWAHKAFPSDSSGWAVLLALAAAFSVATSATFLVVAL